MRQPGTLFGLAEYAGGAARHENAQRYRLEAAAIAVIAICLLFRIYLAATLGLGVDESYAVTVSRVPTLSFFDHPPLGFMLARWTAEIAGTEAALCVRLPYLALFTGSSVLLYTLTWKLFSHSAAFWAVAWFSVAPFFLVSVGSWVVPDGPLTFFLLLGACLLRPLIVEERPSYHWVRWTGIGIAFGLALLSKYQAFLVGFGVLMLLLGSAGGKRLLTKPGLYLAGLVAVVLFMPVIVWNAQHEWQSFAFQAGRAVAGPHFSLADSATNVVRMALGQMVYLLPGPFLLTIWLLWGAMRSGRPSLETRFCAALALPPILLFNALAPFAKSFLPHWPMAGFIFAFPLIGDWVSRLQGSARHLSFTNAGMELRVGQAAVSHQVKSLEERLGVQLFRRLPRGLALTDEGQALIPTISEAFGRIRATLDQFEHGHFRGVVTVGVVATFAVGWLMPHLSAFYDQHPFVDLRIQTNNNRVDPAGEGLDFAIRYGDGSWHATHATHLLAAPLSVMCTPEIAERISHPEDLGQEVLCRSYRADEWPRWFAAANVACPPIKGPIFDSSIAMAEAVAQGTGLALLPVAMFEYQLARGRLVRPFQAEVSIGDYWLTSLKSKVETDAMRAFRLWLAVLTAGDRIDGLGSHARKNVGQLK